MGPLDILHKVLHNSQIDGSVSICPEIYVHASLIDLDLGIWIQTRTAKMSAWGGCGEIYHYSVFALLELYWNVHIFFYFFFASNGSRIQSLVHTNI